MKHLILLLFIPVISYSQRDEFDLHKTVFNNYKTMLGKSVKSVKDYWTTKVSIVYITELLENGDGEIDIMYGKAGNPDFSAIFQKGKCVDQTLILDVKEVSIMQAKLMKMGFLFDKKNNDWRNKLLKQMCKFDQIGGEKSSVYQFEITNSE